MEENPIKRQNKLTKKEKKKLSMVKKFGKNSKLSSKQKKNLIGRDTDSDSSLRNNEPLLFTRPALESNVKDTAVPAYRPYDLRIIMYNMGNAKDLECVPMSRLLAVLLKEQCIEVDEIDLYAAAYKVGDHNSYDCKVYRQTDKSVKRPDVVDWRSGLGSLYVHSGHARLKRKMKTAHTVVFDTPLKNGCGKRGKDAWILTTLNGHLAKDIDPENIDYVNDLRTKLKKVTKQARATNMSYETFVALFGTVEVIIRIYPKKFNKPSELREALRPREGPTQLEAFLADFDWADDEREVPTPTLTLPGAWVDDTDDT